MVHDTACAGTADKTILAPAIHIPGSHPGHQTKNHPARKGGNISSDEIKKKNEERDPQISQMGGRMFTAEDAEVRRGDRMFVLARARCAEDLGGSLAGEDGEQSSR